MKTKKYTLIIEKVDGDIKTSIKNSGLSNAQVVFVLDLEKLRILNQVKGTAQDVQKGNPEETGGGE